MILKVYEYQIKDKNLGTYTGSYTIKAGSPKEQELAKQLKAKFVEEFEH